MGHPLRLFVAGLVHESSSFSPLPTSLQSFREGVLIQRSDPQALRKIEAQPVLSGVLAAARRNGDTLVPGLFAAAEPAGPLSKPNYEHLRDELLADLRAAMPVDAVLLVLHGAMLADGYPDCEGDLLQRARAIVGDAVPMGALLDLHTNLSPAMLDSGAVLVACKEYPHIDYTPRGEELHAALLAMASGEFKVRAHWRRVPMLGIFGTTEPRMREFVQQLKSGETLPGVVSVSALHGFPWSDTLHTSAAIVVMAQDSPAAAAVAEPLAQELSQSFYAQREQAKSKLLPLPQALDAAVATIGAMRELGLVVLADTADNPGGGAAGDSTFALRLLLERGIRETALGMIWDPQAVAVATSAGVGARLRMRIGGKVGPTSGDPLDLEVEVLACRSDARQRGFTPGGTDPLGAAVALRTQGIDIVLNSIRQQVFSPDCFTELGIDLGAKRLVVVKSTQHFRSGFDAISAATVYADSAGSLQSDLSVLPYRHLPRPIWPLDGEVSV